MASIRFEPKTHSYFGSNGKAVHSVTQILATAGICDYSAVPQEFLERGKKRGTSVHWMLQLEDEHTLNRRKIPHSMRPFLKAYRLWCTLSGFVPLAIEQSFISEGFAGTIDRAGSFPSHPRLGVVDIKTGALQEWVRYQLAAYAVGWMKDVRHARLVRRIALRLTASGDYKVTEYPLDTFDTDWAKFCWAKGKVNAGNCSAGIESA